MQIWTTAELWEEILSVAKTAQDTDNRWMHGYRAGMVRTYARAMDIPIDEVNKLLISDLRNRAEAEAGSLQKKLEAETAQLGVIK